MFIKIVECIADTSCHHTSRDCWSHTQKGVNRTMKKLVSVIAAVAMLSIASFSFAASMKGPISKISKNPDGTYAVTVQDSISGKAVELQVSDELTVGKLDSKKMVVDDDVKVKFDEKDGKNLSTKMLKSAGC